MINNESDDVAIVIELDFVYMYYVSCILWNNNLNNTINGVVRINYILVHRFTC